MRPTIPQGTRDFPSAIVKKRTYIFETIRHHFELHGFSPLETPAFEQLETLIGKYGDEGDKLLFKILNNGLDRPEKADVAKASFENVLNGKSDSRLTERALKYDLTIPFARYVAMHHGQLTFPYKRYQIQPVWRADRPQRGRYREFYQCDADCIGSNSLLYEIDLIQLYKSVFESLSIPVKICINNRKLLAALAELCGGESWLIPITVAIDKLDKIGIEKVINELRQKQLTEEQLSKINYYLSLTTLQQNEEIINTLSAFYCENEIGQKGIEELKYILHHHRDITLDVTLARGLNYYTGTILEVKPTSVSMGSIGGGGRYDDLTGMFGLKGMSGVGISFGLDRIYDVMEELNLFPNRVADSLQVMIIHTGEEFLSVNLKLLNQLRKHHLQADMYPDAVKFDKQFKYAAKRNTQWVIVQAENELKEGCITVKEFATSQQEKMSIQQFIERCRTM
jgi:histidyl-tRNA synthetase (EC 6.1.1.21)